MPEFRIVGKDEIPEGIVERTLEVHWKLSTNQEKVGIDYYPGDAEIFENTAGAVIVEYTEELPDGSRKSIKVTYGYGEAKKTVETAIYRNK